MGNRVFWTTAIPENDLRVDAGAGTVELRVDDLAFLDYPSMPVSLGPGWQTAFVGATASFDVVWHGPATRTLDVRDGTNGDKFAGVFALDQASFTWSARNVKVSEVFAKVA